MEPMVIVVVVLTVLMLGAGAAAGWLAFDRSRLMGRLATLAAGRDEVARLVEEREGEAAAARAKADGMLAKVDELQVEAATLRERFASREREYQQAVKSIEQRYQERAARDEEKLRELSEQTRQAFDSLAAKALDQSAERFLKLATQTFEKQQAVAGSEMEKRQKAFRDLLIPVADSLRKTDEKLGALDKARVEARAALDEQLRALSAQASGLGEETARLVRSLKSPTVRGRWGEMTLKRVVELAGMSGHCDFVTQEIARDGDGAVVRPDMLIRLPGGRTIVLDAKTPLHAYLESMEAVGDEQRAAKLKQHAKQVRQKIDELGGKQYQQQFEEAPDFTVLFIPGDQFLSAALLEDASLLDDAASKQVILTTPATLIALLKAVQYGWAQASLADDAREVLRLGRDLHDRIGVMSEHLSKLGDRLRMSVESYNRAVGSMESRVLPAARQMEEHNIRSARKVDEVGQVTVAPRLPAGAEVDEGDVRGQQRLDVVTRGVEPGGEDADGEGASGRSKKARRRSAGG